MSTDPFTHPERALVDQLGLTQKRVRVVRSDELERKVDWDNVAGEVRYSTAGRVRLLALLKISSVDSVPPQPAPALPIPPPVEPEKNSLEPLAPPAVAGPAVPAPGDQEQLTVRKCYAPNVRMLEAVRANGEVVLVRVRDNRKLRPKMTMKCRYGGGRIWELAQPLPRFPGKW